MCIFRVGGVLIGYLRKLGCVGLYCRKYVDMSDVGIGG